jgi:hypothetical protein
MKDPLTPDATTLIKLGSIIVHYQEFTSPSGHPFDLQTVRQLEKNPDVVEWMAEMQKKAYLPEKRQAPEEQNNRHK